MRNVLITGATGFLGGAALSYILKEKSECQLLLLTRGESTKHAVMRVNENLRKFQLAETLINRISSGNILLGDLTAPDFFLKIVVSMPLLTSSIVRISPHPVIIRLSGQGMWRGCSGLSIV
ncbi:SDR family oxidoreductase [Klebsiella pneumoniae]|nr:SDR family oxidoreductase [Klebsiella pneumoniae]